MVYFYVLSSKNILMKQVVYQQLTCLCVKMEFVVGIISLSCEMYSLSWSCFRSCASGTVVYEKWCFDLHVKRCGSCMVSTIGVGASKFFGCEGFLPKFSQTCPKRFGRLCLQFFSLKDHEDLFGMTSKKGLHVFFCKRWTTFYEIKQDWAPFCPEFQILPRFPRTFSK